MSRPWTTASAIERVVECQASTVLPQTQSNSTYAQSGKNIHYDIEAVVLGGSHPTFNTKSLDLPPNARAEIAFSYDVISGEAKEIGSVGDRQYPKSPFSTMFGTVDCIGEYTLIPSGDVIVSTPNCVDVIDWKTTYEAPQPDSWQMRILGFMAAKARGLSYARTRITHIRDGRINHSKWKLWTNVDFMENEVILKRTYDSVNKLGWKKEITLADVRHGPHCHFCPAYLSCVYPKSLLQHNGGGDPAALISDRDATNAYSRWQALRTLTGRLEDAVKGFALQKPIDIGNGYLYGKPAAGANFRKFRMYNPEEE